MLYKGRCALFDIYNFGRLMGFLSIVLPVAYEPCRNQVYTLEKVLKMKKDTLSGINFLDEAMKVWL